MTQVVITGIGVVTPIGIGSTAFWEGLTSGASGAGRLTAFDPQNLPVSIAAQVDDFEAGDWLDPREVPRSGRFTHMGVAAASLALADAGLGDEHPGETTGVIVGSGIGGLQTIEAEHDAYRSGGPRRVSPFMVPKLMPNAAAAAIAMRFGFLGPNFAPSSACATGAHAIGEAYRYLKWGGAEVMIAGGTEAALTPLAVSAFARMGALSTRNDDPAVASRPFDRDRDGFVFGEGAGILVLETREHAEARGAEIIAELAGYGATADAYHVTQPDPEGKGAIRAMHAAMDDARVAPHDVDYINAHGTSTPYNDRTETAALKAAFGTEVKAIPVSSTKSQTGHLLGAAGGVEAAVCALAIRNSVVPGTINLDEPDPDCDLDYVPDGPREHDVRVALSNSFGFGGQNACLIVRRWGS